MEHSPRRYFEDVELGDELGPMSLNVSQEQVVAYCRVWGRPIPNRFTDSEMAQREGMRGTMVPGPLSMAYMAHLVSEWSADAQVRRLESVFRRPISLGQQVELSGVVVDKEIVDGEKQIQCDLYIKSLEGDRLIGGKAVISLASRPV